MQGATLTSQQKTKIYYEFIDIAVAFICLPFCLAASFHQVLVLLASICDLVTTYVLSIDWLMKLRQFTLGRQGNVGCFSSEISQLSLKSSKTSHSSI